MTKWFSNLEPLGQPVSELHSDRFENHFENHFEIVREPVGELVLELVPQKIAVWCQTSSPIGSPAGFEVVPGTPVAPASLVPPRFQKHSARTFAPPPLDMESLNVGKFKI